MNEDFGVARMILELIEFNWKQYGRIALRNKDENCEVL